MNNSTTGKRNQETAFRYSKLQTIKYRGDRKMKVMVIGSKTICRKSYKSQKPVNGSVIYAVYPVSYTHLSSSLIRNGLGYFFFHITFLPNPRSLPD